MLKIGVLGDEDGTACEVIKEILEKNKQHIYFAKVSNSDEIRNDYMEAVVRKAKVLLLDLNFEDEYEKLSILKFDILLFLTKKKREAVALHSLLKDKNYLIIDSDDPVVKRIATNKNTTVITCGFNNSASVSVSSVEWEFANELQFCFQRTLETVDGGEIEPQEIKYAKNYEDTNIINILAAVVAAILSGAKV